MVTTSLTTLKTLIQVYLRFSYVSDFFLFLGPLFPCVFCPPFLLLEDVLRYQVVLAAYSCMCGREEAAEWKLCVPGCICLSTLLSGLTM